MKKILSIFFVALAVFSLASCNKKEEVVDGEFTEFAVDGEFTAFELDYNRAVPMYTTVTVKIEGGKIQSYYIDARQGSVDQETGKFVWNAKTKKELKLEYGMLPASEIEKEWFEQAKSLEDYMLQNGPEAVTVNDEGYIDNVTGVSVKDGGYTTLAKKAVENAKANKFLAFEHGYTNQNGPQFTWAEVTTDNEGKVTKIFLDCVQSTKATDSEDKVSFTWNAKSKKELGPDYKMLPASEIGKEWFEQAKALEDFMLENGVDAVKTDDGNYIDNVTGVSVKDGGYTTVVKAAIALIKK